MVVFGFTEGQGERRIPAARSDTATVARERPSPKAIDWARSRKPWTQSEGDRSLSKSQQDVRDGSISFAASDQESRRDERFLCECEGWMN